MTKKAQEPIIIFDTTLRDGEQAPGNTMFDWEKKEIAEKLADAGVDVIEAGFPAASSGDFNSVHSVAEHLVSVYSSHPEDMPTIAALAMARPDHIEAAAKALEPAISVGKGRIHTFIGSSEIHADRKLRKTQETILAMAVDAVRLARTYTDTVEFSPEDASRTGKRFLEEISVAAARNGARTINVPDTVGYSVPAQYGSIIRGVNRVVMPYGTLVSVHCHNDLGRAVDNSLAGLLAGARQVECTVNGIGERAGNASVEQIVMNLIVRNDYYAKRGLTTRFNYHIIGELSRMVSVAIGSWPSANTPIVGDNAFSHQAGIHQDGVSKSENTYEIMTPESVGWHGEKYVIGKHSGKAGVEKYLKEIGYDGFERDTERISLAIKAVADIQKHVFDNDAHSIMKQFGYHPRRLIITVDLDDVVYTRVVTPSVRLPVSWDEVASTIKGMGNGPVDAAYEAIKKYSGNGIELSSFKIGAMGKGEQARAGARVTIERKGKLYVARGGHEDTIIAAVSAYVNAINRSIVDIR